MLHTRECEGDRLFFFPPCCILLAVCSYALERPFWEPRKLFPFLLIFKFPFLFFLNIFYFSLFFFSFSSFEALEVAVCIPEYV